MTNLSEAEIFKKLEDEWDFEALLEPYREGGPGPERPVRRTWGTLIDWLKNKRGFPPDIIGAAIFGVGWGISGQCPGSAIASLGVGNIPVLIGIVSMFLGAYIMGRLFT